MPDDEYEVGYGKPPVATRFKPGQSGNPKGKQKKPKPETKLKPVLKNVLEEPINIGGRNYTPMEVIARTLMNKAMKADMRAIKAVMELEQSLGSTSQRVARVS